MDSETLKRECRGILKALVPPYVNDYRTAAINFLKKKLTVEELEEFMLIPTGVEDMLPAQPEPVPVEEPAPMSFDTV